MKRNAPSSLALSALAAACLAGFTPTLPAQGTLDNGLQARWKFDESTGLVAADASGHGHNGDLVNFIGDDSQWIAGQDSGAIAFSGDNYVEVPDDPGIGADLVGGFSVAAWFRPNVALSAGGAGQRMLEKGNSYFFLQGVGNGGMNFLVKRGGANVVATIGESLEPNRWYHIAGTFDGADIRVYLDGELKGTNHVGANIDDEALPLIIGADDAGSFFNGAMDDVRIWNRALTDREVRNVMGRDLPEPPSIFQAPIAVQNFAGANATFTVGARGQEPLSFQWYKGEEPIASATEPTLALQSIQPTDAGQYKVKISNALGETFSTPVALDVIPITGLETGRQAFWKFDETTGLSAADSSGNNNTGQLTDYGDTTSQWSAGKVGGALSFDGEINRVIVPDSDSLDLPADATFGFWIKPATYGSVRSAGTYDLSEGRILRKDGQFDIWTVDNPGGVRQTILANGVNPPQGSLELGVWQHFAIVFRGGMVTFYKNGFPVGDPVPGTLGDANTSSLVLGNYDEGLDTPRFFNGQLDEVGIWKRPLSDGEILELAGLDASGAPVVISQPEGATVLAEASVTFEVLATGKRPVTYQWRRNGNAISGATSNRLILPKVSTADAGDYTVLVTNSEGEATSDPAKLVVKTIEDVTSGLIAYYDFDETSGMVLHDRSGNGHDAALQGNPASPGVAGQIGGAFDFDGASDFAVAPHSDSLNATDQITISAWINPRTYSVEGGYSRIARKDINYDFNILDSSHSLRFFGINKTPYDAPNGQVELDVWQHVAVVFKGGTVQFYKNGQPIGQTISGQLGTPNTKPLVIGNFQADLAINRIYNGLMDDLGIWNRALSATDVEGIYQNGLAGKPLTTKFEGLNIRSLEVSAGNQLRLTFFSPYADGTYEVQRADSLTGGTWSAQSGVQFTSQAQGLVLATFPTPATGVAFFRIVAQPPPASP